MDYSLKHCEDKTNVGKEWDNIRKIQYGKQQKGAYEL